MPQETAALRGALKVICALLKQADDAFAHYDEDKGFGALNSAQNVIRVALHMSEEECNV